MFIMFFFSKMRKILEMIISDVSYHPNHLIYIVPFDFIAVSLLLVAI